MEKILKHKFRNRFEYRFSKLSEKQKDMLLKKIIKKLCESEANTLDFYDFSKHLMNKNKE